MMESAHPRPTVLIGITLAALAWCVGMIGVGGWVAILLLVASALVLFGAVIHRYPQLTTAFYPVLYVPPQQVLELFVSEIFLIGVFCILVAVGIRNRSAWVGRLSWLEVLVLAQLTWCTLTVFWSPVLYPHWMFGMKVYVLGFLALWVALRVSRFVDHELLLLGIPAGACALGLAVAVQATRTGFFQAVDTSRMRTSATDVGWGVSNYLAAIVALMLPSGLYMALNGRTRLQRFIGWMSLPLSVLVVTTGASRGGAVMLIAIALFAIFGQRIKPWIAIPAGLSLVLLLILGPGGEALLGRFNSVEQSYSMVVRVVYFREAWTRTVNHWPVGMGLEQGAATYDRLGEEDPHNYWFSLSSELGLVGLVLWIAISVRIWMLIRRMIRDPVREQAGRALRLTFVVAQLNLIFEPTMPGVQYQALFYWIVGVFIGIFGREEPPEHRPREGAGSLSPQPG
jgi:hypothetical protein